MPIDLIIVILAVSVIVGTAVYLLSIHIHNVVTATEARITALLHRQHPPPTPPVT